MASQTLTVTTTQQKISGLSPHCFAFLSYQLSYSGGLANGDDGTGTVPIPTDCGQIIAADLCCGSDDYDIELLQSSVATEPSIDRKFVRNSKDNRWHETLDAYFCNADGEEKLYLKITNNDSGNVTGVIYFDLVLKL